MTARRWAWVEVDPSAIRRNVSRLASLTADQARMMAVVKADGYGHGAAVAARAALQAGASWLGVATVDEGLSLRESGVSVPILLLAEAPPDAAGDIIEADLTPTVASHRFATALGEAAGRAGRAVGFHLKVDTGMNRIGVRAEDAAEFLRSLEGTQGLAMEGLFTHFATAEIPGDWEFEQQMQRFSEAFESIKAAGHHPGIVHAANSAATILHPGSHLSMVRCGIAIYGLHPGEATRPKIDLVPAMSVKARVAQVKKVGMGEGVSYGLTWKASGPTTVATLPLGYADGLHRVLSDGFDVLIGGRRCRQIGRICMDQCMVEVPRDADVQVGDEVVVVGEQGGTVLTMDALADTAGTINYEMACGFALRMPTVTV